MLSQPASRFSALKASGLSGSSSFSPSISLTLQLEKFNAKIPYDGTGRHYCWYRIWYVPSSVVVFTPPIDYDFSTLAIIIAAVILGCVVATMMRRRRRMSAMTTGRPSPERISTAGGQFVPQQPQVGERDKQYSAAPGNVLPTDTIPVATPQTVVDLEAGTGHASATTGNACYLPVSPRLAVCLSSDIILSYSHRISLRKRSSW